ncbi:MAG: hypothetical protein OER04_12485, partial [Cyclobacteriaceae bacterium]|nr:hypothetical protein [Cyclobacteriaceae bacterium]
MNSRFGNFSVLYSEFNFHNSNTSLAQLRTERQEMIHWIFLARGPDCAQHQLSESGRNDSNFSASLAQLRA